ncbi:hypothetical protein GobsT_69540 [Gemmata obscuriglobus]|uniref:Carboxypeptidase regulatory-like domain-containing protein n=1 Tax=Gemmata obscuriglobus TaxID=114 RepID=A0A2Z3H536_9BACT|nr:hypothetical protein [Gemmata obscuriglobus]AWM41919.1 hypothetical protein C1280_36285 [Gemmata obscuriglobus]QEG32103.1 hypothetical protein GobsT_69540 [Gemmata obscuriglobus]VTS11456.1 unnamed protein product [Gemmata obscuriglobus UQM 2246]
MIRRISPFQAILFLAICAASGCGGSQGNRDDSPRGVVNGKLVDNNKPFALDASKVPVPKGARSLPPGVSGALSIVFISSDTKESYTADVNADAGTFQVKGIDGKGIKAGRYRIAVTGRMGISPDTPDYFGGKFTPEKTQILRDVKAGDEVVIDVAKPQG